MATKSVDPMATRRQHNGQHALPPIVNWFQDHVLLLFLLLAEAYLLGSLFAIGWVKWIEDPASWGRYHGVGVVLFFLAGAGCAGIGLRCSVAAAGSFRRREWGFGVFNFLGVLVFCGAEVWASLSERSQNLAPTPADQTVLQTLGFNGAPISPTLVAIALLLPFATLYYGFSQQSVVETAEERQAKAEAEDAALQRKLHQAEMQAKIRVAQAQGLAGAVRAGIDAARAKQDEKQDAGTWHPTSETPPLPDLSDWSIGVDENPFVPQMPPPVVQGEVVLPYGAYGREAAVSDPLTAHRLPAHVREPGADLPTTTATRRNGTRRRAATTEHDERSA